MSQCKTHQNGIDELIIPCKDGKDRSGGVMLKNEIEICKNYKLTFWLSEPDLCTVLRQMIDWLMGDLREMNNRYFDITIYVYIKIIEASSH